MRMSVMPDSSSPPSPRASGSSTPSGASLSCSSPLSCAALTGRPSSSPSRAAISPTERCPSIRQLEPPAAVLRLAERVRGVEERAGSEQRHLGRRAGVALGPGGHGQARRLPLPSVRIATPEAAVEPLERLLDGDALGRPGAEGVVGVLDRTHLEGAAGPRPLPRLAVLQHVL